jgi:hypothetical protein
LEKLEKEIKARKDLLNRLKTLRKRKERAREEN